MFDSLHSGLISYLLGRKNSSPFGEINFENSRCCLSNFTVHLLYWNCDFKTAFFYFLWLFVFHHGFFQRLHIHTMCCSWFFLGLMCFFALKRSLCCFFLSAKIQERKKHPAEATEGILCIFDPQCLDPLDRPVWSGCAQRETTPLTWSCWRWRCVSLEKTGYHHIPYRNGQEEVLLMTTQNATGKWRVNFDNPSGAVVDGKQPHFKMKDSRVGLVKSFRNFFHRKEWRMAGKTTLSRGFPFEISELFAFLLPVGLKGALPFGLLSRHERHIGII